jgi:hypothetical protein
VGGCGRDRESKQHWQLSYIGFYSGNQTSHHNQTGHTGSRVGFVFVDGSWCWVVCKRKSILDKANDDGKGKGKDGSSGKTGCPVQL